MACEQWLTAILSYKLGIALINKLSSQKYTKIKLYISKIYHPLKPRAG